MVLLISTDDDMWSKLDTMQPEALHDYWDTPGKRDAYFRYIVRDDGSPEGLVGYTKGFANDGNMLKLGCPDCALTEPDATPPVAGATPGRWTHMEGQKVAFCPWPFHGAYWCHERGQAIAGRMITAGGFDRSKKWNYLAHREFRILAYATDRDRFPLVIAATPPFFIRQASTARNNKVTTGQTNVLPKHALPRDRGGIPPPLEPEDEVKPPKKQKGGDTPGAGSSAVAAAHGAGAP